MVGVGDVAPDFGLEGTGGRRYCLAEARGAPVVLAFYPADNTPVCTRQLVTYSAALSEFADLGARLFALSPQDVASHEAFAAEHGLSFPLLADTAKEVAGSYGVLGPLGYYRRSVFVIDAGGIIRYAHRSVGGLSFRRSDELVEAVRKAQAAPAAP
jgi:peroxiredoxin Q/BCP